MMTDVGTTMNETMVIDGAQGEGGGQMLRSSLALSMCTGRPLRMHGIRARRRKPGLMRQHLTAVRAAGQVCGAAVQGDTLRSTELSFAPGPVRPGEYHYAVGTAGSTTLVLQTVLWPLLLAPGRSRLVLEGGTHNPMAPPFEFIAHSLVPRLVAMGARIDVSLERYGFHPAGGGRLVVEIHGGAELRPWQCLERGPVQRVRARAILSGLAVDIGRRELHVVQQCLGWPSEALEIERVESIGPGNILVLEMTHGGGTTVVVGFGAKGIRAEQVADRAVDEAEVFLSSGVPVDAHLADQLLIPLALAGGGCFCTTEPTLHTETQAEILQRWLPVTIELSDRSEGVWLVSVLPRGGSGR